MDVPACLHGGLLPLGALPAPCSPPSGPARRSPSWPCPCITPRSELGPPRVGLRACVGPVQPVCAPGVGKHAGPLLPAAHLRPGDPVAQPRSGLPSGPQYPAQPAGRVSNTCQIKGSPIGHTGAAAWTGTPETSPGERSAPSRNLVFRAQGTETTGCRQDVHSEATEGPGKIPPSPSAAVHHQPSEGEQAVQEGGRGVGRATEGLRLLGPLVCGPLGTGEQPPRRASSEPPFLK